MGTSCSLYDLHFGTFLAYLCSGGPSKMTSMFTKYGKYPREYNPKVHGPYWPGRYYGKPDTKFADVKLGDLFSWIARRDKGVAPTWQMVHRGYWNWVRKWWQVKEPRFAGPAQVIMAFSTMFFFVWYERRSWHKHAKYH